MVKNKTFYNISNKINIFCIQNNIGLDYFADIRFGMFLIQIDIDKNRIFSEMKILLCTQNDVVVNFNDVIRIAHCALNIESTQHVAILTFQRTL